jgi:hypothetical protein
MNKFIISESEKQRILEMHQNATSRQYLTEQRGSGVVYIYLPYKMVNGEKKVAKEVFSTADYAPTYSFPLGVKEKTETYKISTIETPDGQRPQLMTQNEAKGSDGNINIQGKLGGYELPTKFSWGPQLSQGVVYFSDKQNKQYGFSYQPGKLYTPTQKESDLTKIVKRVINERRYLTEDETASQLIAMTIEIPTTKDPKGNTVIVDGGTVKYRAVNEKGTKSSSLDNYSSFTSFKFGDTNVTPTSTKAQDGSIYGAFLIPKGSTLKSYLNNMLKLSNTQTQNTVLVTSKLTNNQTQPNYGWPTYKTYDAGPTQK